MKFKQIDMIDMIDMIDAGLGDIEDLKEEIKVGDTVELIKGDSTHKAGHRFVVLGSYFDPEYWKGDNTIFSKYNVKLIKRKEMTKEDLKTGMRVELNNGDVYIYAIGKNGKGVAIKGGNDFLSFSYYDNSLVRYGDKNCEYTIAKVYDLPDMNAAFINSNIKGNLLWERKSEVPSYTMAELTEKLGHEFKLKK